MTEQSSDLIELPSIRTCNNFDELRLILASLVILDHSFTEVGKNDPLTDLSVFRFHLGTTAVYGFFLLSGFLVTNSWNFSSGRLDFVRKRCLRIYPGLMCALIITVSVFAPLGGCKFPEMFSSPEVYDFLSGPLLLRDMSPLVQGFCTSNIFPNNLNAPLWSIRFEIVCYFIVFILGSFSLLGRKWTLPIALFLAQILAFKCPSEFFVPYFGNISYFPLLTAFFLSGAFLCQFEKSIEKVIPRSAVLAALAVAFLVALPRPFDCFTMPMVGAYLLWLLGRSPKLPFFDCRRFGDLSYGLYIYSFPIQQLILYYLGPSKDPASLFIGSWLVTAIFAFVSWHCLEKPFLSLKKKRIKG